MASWLKDILGSVIFFLSVTSLWAGFRVIASQILVGIRTVLGLELGIQRILAGGGCVILGAVLGGLSLEISSLP